jgi:hypothetical protein
MPLAGQPNFPKSWIQTSAENPDKEIDVEHDSAETSAPWPSTGTWFLVHHTEKQQPLWM